MTTFYHCTATQAARVILKEGFRDNPRARRPGVWLTDEPDAIDPAHRLFVLRLETALPIERFAEFEQNREEHEAFADGFREWLVPVALVNENAVVSVHEECPDYEELRQQAEQVQ